MPFRVRAHIGGHDKSQAEREPAMQKFRAQRSMGVKGGWKHQCRCGSTVGWLYRGRWWCSCGASVSSLADYALPCGCMLCKFLEVRRV